GTRSRHRAGRARRQAVITSPVRRARPVGASEPQPLALQIRPFATYTPPHAKRTSHHAVDTWYLSPVGLDSSEESEQIGVHDSLSSATMRTGGPTVTDTQP